MSTPTGPAAPAASETPSGWALPELAPARILNEFAYCPRLAYLEWVHGEFEHSADTLDGAWKHRRVTGDGQHATLDADADDPQVPQLRSVHLSAPDLGLVAVVDVLEADGDGDGPLVPVDYKRGRIPDLPERAWEPERVQLCAQGPCWMSRRPCSPRSLAGLGEGQAREPERQSVAGFRRHLSPSRCQCRCQGSRHSDSASRDAAAGRRRSRRPGAPPRSPGSASRSQKGASGL